MNGQLGGGGGSGGAISGAGGGGGGGAASGPGAINTAGGGYAPNQNGGFGLGSGSVLGVDGGSPITVSSGGGGGGAAYMTMAGVYVSGYAAPGTQIRGGNGGNSTWSASLSLGAGGGGGGGAGIVGFLAKLDLQGDVYGGMGGSSMLNAGGGGDGVVLRSGTITLGPHGTVSGGAGGVVVGVGSTPGAHGGDGGTGVSIGTGSVVNEGRILGGVGWDASGLQGTSGTHGAALRAGNNTQVTNKGRFSSGSAAVVFEGNDNTLTLWQGSSTTGDVRFEGARNTLALGSDPGTPTASVTVMGALTFGTAGIYAVRATATAADRLTVTGGATLTGATVQVAAAAGNYAENTTYDILHADGTFNGTRFAGTSTDLAYLTPSLIYSANDQDAQLTLTRKQVVQPGNPGGPSQPVEPANPGIPSQPETGGTPPSRPIRFADLVAGRNVIATANAIDGMPAGNEVYGHALNLPNGAPQSFFTALSGESHANAIGALQGLSGQARSLPFSHLRANLGAGMRAGSPTAAVGASDAAPASSVLPTSRAQPAWAELVGNWQRLGATGDTSEVRMHTGGLFAGGDGAIGAGWRLGGALGYTDSNLRTEGVDDKTDISSYSAIVYGGRAFEAGVGKLNLLLGGAYTWHDINSKRRIAAGGLDQTLRADYGANTTQLFTELGYAMALGQSLTLEPYAGLAWANLRSRAFQESGGSAALSGASQTNQTTTSTLGLRGRQALTSGKFQGTLTAGAGWRHAFGDVSPTSQLAFDAGNAFTVAGAPIARNAALLEAGLDASVGRNATVGLSYAGQFGSGNQDHSATLAWRWAF